MNRFLLGFKALWRVWVDEADARRVESVLDGAGREVEAAAPPRPTRSDALTLLAVLQREGRLVDFLQEPIDGYSDAQIGAAVRDVHKGCSVALGRMMGLEPLVGDAEGSRITVPSGFDPQVYRLVGHVTGEPPHQGALRHHGWKAGRCVVPDWTGSDAAALVVAPAEVEL